MRRSVRTGLAAVAMSGVVLAGCGGGGSTSTGTPANVVVHGDDALKFDQKQYTATAGSVSITPRCESMWKVSRALCPTANTT